MTKDPYKIWLSEIILQQTRIDQGLPYYLSFIQSFPTVHDLSEAETDIVLKHWEGLGYYSRARNLHLTAKFVAHELNGVFPKSYQDLLRLKGVGPYTAAAIASICYGEIVPVLDGNVFRFTSRFFGIKNDIGASSSRKIFTDILDEIISHEHPGDFNQAIMEFGATVCKPQPDCEYCCFRNDCYAYKHKLQHQLPVKLKKVKIKERFFHYYIIESDDMYLMGQRNSGIWNGLYEFPLIETGTALPKDEVPFLEDHMKPKKKSASFKHLLTHRVLWINFYHYQTDSKHFTRLMNEFDFDAYSYEEMLTLPKPKSIVNYLQHGGF